jgi:hypothetical protein
MCYFRENISVSTRLEINSDSDTAGNTRATSRDGANSDICAANRSPTTRSGAWCTSIVPAPFERIATDIPRPFPGSKRGTRFSWLPRISSPSGRRYTPSITKRHQPWLVPKCPTDSASSGSRERCTMTRAGTLSLGLCKTWLGLLRISKTGTTPLHPQSDSMVERHVKAVESTAEGRFYAPERWDEVTHLPTGLQSMNAWDQRNHNRQQRATSALWRIILDPHDNEQSSTDCVVDLVDRLRGMHQYVRQQLKVASDRMQDCNDRVTNSAGFQEGDQVWLYPPPPTRTRGKSPKFKQRWEGPDKVISRISDVVWQTSAIRKGYSGRAASKMEQCRKPPSPAAAAQPALWLEVTPSPLGFLSRKAAIGESAACSNNFCQWSRMQPNNSEAGRTGS